MAIHSTSRSGRLYLSQKQLPGITSEILEPVVPFPFKNLYSSPPAPILRGVQLFMIQSSLPG